jgi:hypothetical protein
MDDHQQAIDQTRRCVSFQWRSGQCRSQLSTRIHVNSSSTPSFPRRAPSEDPGSRRAGSLRHLARRTTAALALDGSSTYLQSERFHVVEIGPRTGTRGTDSFTGCPNLRAAPPPRPTLVALRHVSHLLAHDVRRVREVLRPVATPHLLLQSGLPALRLADDAVAGHDAS